jgi:2-polyprenyl-3-methyl-5-hydroxy-6-metoxy-1,4-benzoquinol methylase
MTHRQRIYNGYVRDNIERNGVVTSATLEHLAVVYQKTVIHKFFPGNKDIRILDLGCGYGPFLYACHKSGYRNLWGVDTSPEQVTLAHRLGVKQVLEGDIREFLRGRPESFEVITAFDVLEHFAKGEVMEILDLVNAALTRGGLFILRAPNGEGPFAGRYRYWDFTHELAFTRNSLMQVLRNAGLTEVTCHETAPVPHGVKSAVRLVLWKLLRTLWFFYLVVETGNYRDDYILTQNILAVARK